MIAYDFSRVVLWIPTSQVLHYKHFGWEGRLWTDKKELCQTLHSHAQSIAELSHHAGRLWKKGK